MFVLHIKENGQNCHRKKNILYKMFSKQINNIFLRRTIFNIF